MRQITSGTECPENPPLRYHGGKLLRKSRSATEIYNDIDGEVVSFFRVLRNRAKAEELSRLAEMTPYARAELEWANGKADNNADHDIDTALKLLIKSGMGYGGIGVKRDRASFRFDGGKNTKASPPGVWRKIPDTLKAVSQRFRGVMIEQMDASALIAKCDTPDTLFFADPLYLINTHP